MGIVIAVVAVLLVVGLVVGFVAARRGPDKGALLEPPPAPRPPRPGVGPDDAKPNEPSSGVGLAPRPGEAPPEEETPEALVPEPDAATVAEIEAALAEAVEEEQREAVRPRFRDRLGRARGTVAGYLTSIRSRGVDDETWEELEEALIRADVGVQTTQALLDDLREEVKAKGITDSEALLEQLKGDIKVRLADGDRSLTIGSEPGVPSVWLFVGVNGVGKTTTIGKVAKQQAEAGRKVVMAAGDTFRAAAAEQLGAWAERTGADLVRGAENSDPSAVIYDAVQRAGSRGADLVLADTAGRLHTKTNLMEELKKVRRVADREPGKVTEVLLVLDATTGQNGLTQAKQFTEAVDVTGIVLTKLDGSAKGGIVLAINAEIGLPIKLVGLGETVDDLIEFDPDEFVEALFS
ncbi:MAG: ftsY [Acidimicrobiales bacterium]|jgi:fused signal recognition particle receptor|nr:ftsY [Acidimicrobiales bacterium]